MSLSVRYGKSLCYQTLPFVMEHELGGDRAVIIVSALVAILSSAISVSKDIIGTEECLCRDNFQKLLQLLNARCPGKRTIIFSDYGHISG